MQNQHTFQQRKADHVFRLLFRAPPFVCGGAEQIPLSNDCVICCFKRRRVENGGCCGGRELGGELNGRG